MNQQYPSEMCIAPSEIRQGDLVAYLDGAGRPEVTRHIARCPACSAEVEALRKVELVLQQALRPAVSQAVLPIEAGRRKAAPNKTHRLGLRNNSSQTSFPNLIWWLSPLRLLQMTLALALVVVLLGITASFFYMLNRGQLGPVSDQSQVVVEAPVARQQPHFVDSKVVIEAAMPDIDQQRIIQFELVESNATQTFVVRLTNVAGEATGSRLERHTIIHPGIIDVPIANRFIIEDRFEIAPPPDLRRMLEQQFREENSLFIQTQPHQSSQVGGLDGDDYKVWAKNRNGVSMLYFARSSDGGETWSVDTPIKVSIGKVSSPQLTIDAAGTLYVVWRNWYNIDSNFFYFARSTDKGQTWEDIVRIEDTTDTTFSPNLFVDNINGHLIVTWENRRNVSTGIYVTRSADGGQTWSDKIRMAHIGS